MTAERTSGARKVSDAQPRTRNLDVDLALLEIPRRLVGETQCWAEVGREARHRAARGHGRDRTLQAPAGFLRQMAHDVVVVGPILEIGTPLVEGEEQEEVGPLLALLHDAEAVAARELGGHAGDRDDGQTL